MKVPQIKLVYSHRLPISQLPKLDCARLAYEEAYKLFDKDQIELKEFMWILFLNRGNRLLGASLTGVGSSHGVVIDKKEILQIALKANASHVITVHNHPSGRNEPSEADVLMHNDIRNAMKAVGMELLDSMIVTPEYGKYYSFADNGL